MLTFDELGAEVEAGAIDTVVVAFTDMQGRLMGKRLHAEFFCEEMADEHPVEGCNYLLALDMEMDPIPGYEIASWERGYGDFAMQPDLGDAAADSLARGDRARPLRRQLARRNAGAAVAAAGAQGADGAGSGARLHADDGIRARVLPPARDLRGGVGAAVRGPDAVRSLHPRLPRPRDDLRRGPHPPDPQRHARRRASRSRPRRARRGRVSTRSTSASPTR